MSNRPPKPVQYEGIFLTSAEVDAIHARCFPAIRDLWFVLVRTGLRLGEAVVGLALAGLRAAGRGCGFPGHAGPSDVRPAVTVYDLLSPDRDERVREPSAPSGRSRRSGE